MSCSTSPRVCLTQPELYAKKLSKKYFADLCSKRTHFDVFGHMSRFMKYRVFLTSYIDTENSVHIQKVYINTEYLLHVQRVYYTQSTLTKCPASK